MILVLFSLIGVAAAQYCGSTASCGHYGPAVCGTNGRTYINTCYLKHAACTAKQHGQSYFTLAHSGACRTGTTTSTHTHCDEICATEEGASVVKVCMSNGITYDSNCDALNAACNASHNHEHLTVVHKGECLDLSTTCDHLPAGTSCLREAKHYMCASNGYTYQNECYLREAQCRLAATDDPIDILHDGLCHDTSTNGTRNVDCSQYVDTSLQGVAIEGASLAMQRCYRSSLGGNILLGGGASTSTYNPVCVDGLTYSSECYFCSKMAAMHKITADQMNMPISHDGACKRPMVVG